VHLINHIQDEVAIEIQKPIQFEDIHINQRNSRKGTSGNPESTEIQEIPKGHISVAWEDLPPQEIGLEASLSASRSWILLLVRICIFSTTIGAVLDSAFIRCLFSDL
jgi:hypothetical protein